MHKEIIEEFKNAFIGKDLYGNYILDYDIMVEILADEETDILEAMDIIESDLKDGFINIEPKIIIMKKENRDE